MGAVAGEAGRAMGRTLWLQALCGALAGGLVLADVGAGWRGLLALPVILGGGAALGPLLAVTPVEPSRLKLALFSSLLSPLVIAVLFAALHLGVGVAPRSALAGALVSGGVLALLGLRSPVRTAAPGRQESVAVLLSLAAAIAVVLDGWGAAGSAARLADGGSVLAATVADGWLSGRGLDSPWFAGAPLDLRPAVSLVIAVLAGAIGAQPSFVAPLLAGWAAVLVGCAAYLACAALARESSPRLAGARDLLAVVAALLVIPATRDPLLLEQQGVGAIDPAEALSWAFGAGVLLSGLHALRSGAAPWPALLGASLLGLTLFHPWAGAAASAAMVGGASLHRRPVLVLVAASAALPGLLQGWAFGGFSFEPFQRGGPGFEGPFGESTTHAFAAAALLVPTLAAGLVAALRSSRGAGPSGDGRAARGWTFVGLLAASWLGLVVWESPRAGEVDALHRTALPSLVLSVGLAATLHSASTGRARALVLGAAAAVFLIAAPRGLQRPPLGDGVAVRDGFAGLVMSGRADAEILAVSRALAWIREARGQEVSEEAALVLRPRGTTRPDRPSLEPLASGLPLWVGGAAPPGARQDRRFAGDVAWNEARQGDVWELRAETLKALFSSDRSAYEPRLERVLRISAERGLALLFVLTDADHRRLRRLDGGGRPVELARLGAELLRRADGTSVYVLRVPQGGGGSSR